jgi:hypothetical protein
VARTGARPAEATAHPGTGWRGPSGHLARLASRRPCRRAAPASGSSASLPGWPGHTRVMSASRRGERAAPRAARATPGQTRYSAKAECRCGAPGCRPETGRAPGTPRSRARAHIAGPGRGARGLDARAGSLRPPAVMLGYPGALLAHGQDDRYETGTDGRESCGCRLLAVRRASRRARFRGGRTGDRRERCPPPRSSARCRARPVTRPAG